MVTIVPTQKLLQTRKYIRRFRKYLTELKLFDGEKIKMFIVV